MSKDDRSASSVDYVYEKEAVIFAELLKINYNIFENFNKFKNDLLNNLIQLLKEADFSLDNNELITKVEELDTLDDLCLFILDFFLLYENFFKKKSTRFLLKRYNQS